MEAFVIRKAEEKDFNYVFQLICELEDFVMDERWFQNLYHENLKSENYYYYVAEIKEKVVGFVSLNFQYPLHHSGRIAEVQELIVNVNFRNLKIGTALLNKVKAIAKEGKCDTIELTSRFKRTDAHRFYENEGFQKTHYKFLIKL